MLKPLPDEKTYNFFIDDNIFFFTDLYRRRPGSIFDNHYLAGLRQAHREFGTLFTLNTFYHNWHAPEFDLSLFPDTFRGEFEANADWLRFAFHARSEFPERPYSDACPDEFAGHYAAWRSELVRIAGGSTLTAPVIVHYFDAVPETRRALRASGMKFFAVRSGNGITYNAEFDQYEIPLDIFLNRWRDDLAGIRNVLETKIAAGQKMLLVGSHEQYAYPHYARYIPEYFDEVFLACRLLTEHGYTPAYFNGIV